MKYIIHIGRIVVGCLFIFSGFIKANDPLGFAYKMEEYFTVFGTELLIPTALYLSVFVCIFEMILGFMLLLGTKTKLVIWLSFLMIVFFTFLTFYSAYYNKVTDCGCFGDFLLLKPWTSFYKDLILLVLILRYQYQSLLTFPNLFNQSNACRIEESEIYHNNKGDIAD